MHPLVIIGLDGGTFDLLDPLIAAGELPTFARLAAEGMRTELRSTMPPVTLPAWSSFLCAAEPAQHGVTDLLTHPAGSYALVPVDATHRRLPTLLARLAAQGLAVASLGVPGTYPPERIDGVVISGFDAPGAARAHRPAVWPPSLWPRLARLGGWRYAAFNEQARGPARAARAGRALLADLDEKERVALALYADRSWDLFFLHLQASDTAAHHLWHLHDSRSPRHRPSAHTGALAHVYRRLDALVGRLLARAPSGARVLVVSDHGMGGASDVAVHVNRALASLGLLRFRTPSPAREAVASAIESAVGRLPAGLLGAGLRLAPRALSARLLALTRRQGIDYGATSAFSDELDHAPSVWVNREGRFPQGTVAPADVPRVLGRVREALLALRDPASGARLVAAVHERDALWPGDSGLHTPDLVIEPAWLGNYRPSFLPSRGPGPIVRRLAPEEHEAPRGSGMPGVHRREGVFLAWGEGVPAVEVPTLGLAEAGALVYTLLGVAPPADLPVAAPPALVRLLGAPAPPSVRPERGSAATESKDPYSDAERALVLRRLRDLGYVD